MIPGYESRTGQMSQGNVDCVTRSKTEAPCEPCGLVYKLVGHGMESEAGYRKDVSDRLGRGLVRPGAAANASRNLDDQKSRRHQDFALCGNHGEPLLRASVVYIVGQQAADPGTCICDDHQGPLISSITSCAETPAGQMRPSLWANSSVSLSQRAMASRLSSPARGPSWG